jgi:peptide/nickel transport system permease protein
MIAFTLRRAGQASLTLVALAVATFFLLHLTPGGPAQMLLGPDRYTPEREAAINRQLGLSQPLPTQLVRWLIALVRGDLGYSYFMRRPAFEVVRERLPATLLLGGLAFIVALVGGVSWGIWAAARRGSWLDRLLSTIAVVTVSIPSFWLGIGLIVVFAAWLRLLPSAGVAAIGREHDVGDRARHLVLPLLTIAAAHTASLALYTRAALMETLGQDYIRTARSLGARERRVLWGHALRNAAIPVTTQAGLTLPHLIEGSVIVESVFSWPGIGQLTIASVGRRDYPILLVVTLLVGVIVVLATFLTDLVYHWLDPRIRYA